MKRMVGNHTERIGYWQLLKNNRQVRRLWLAQVVSELGDWLNFVALVQLIKQFTPNAQAVGWLIVIQMLPLVVVGPVAGIIADRFNRSYVMIVADLIRAVIVLGFLTIRHPDQLWLLYLLAGLQFSITAFFEPARSALLPSLADGQELLLANALTGVTWSTMLAIGGILGGVIAGLVSNRAAFIVDASSFLLSAGLLVALTGAGVIKHRLAGAVKRHDTSWRPALQFLRTHPQVMAVLLVKSGICLTAGGVWLMSVIYGQRIFPIGKEGALSVGVLYGVHGFGSILGAALTGRFLRTGKPVHTIFWSFTLRTGFFLLWVIATSLGQVALAITALTACGSLLWVLSTTLMQQLSPDEMRGRLFALENSLLTLAMVVSTYIVGRSLDVWKFSPSAAMLGTAGCAALVSLAWLGVVLRWPKWERN